MEKKIKQRHSRKSKEDISVAKDRIKKLFDEAAAIFKKEPKLADRYVHLARKIAMKFKIKLTSSQKRKFCKHCYKYLNSKNSRVRTRDGKVIISCFECKKFTRITIK